jgi:hypothetical protein
MKRATSRIALSRDANLIGGSGGRLRMQYASH